MEYILLLELHVDHQDLAAHQNVVFDPRSCSKLKKLRVVNASKNRMVDLKPLDLITSLHNLDISHNLLEDLQDVIDVLSRIPGLKVVNRDSFMSSMKSVKKSGHAHSAGRYPCICMMIDNIVADRPIMCSGADPRGACGASHTVVGHLL